MNLNTTVVTSGETWVDIDAFACAVAYAECLRLQGQEAVTVIPGELNATIPQSYKVLGSFEKNPPANFSSVVLVDISNPNHVAKFVDMNTVTDVFDHHSGFETYWKEKIDERSRIEMIGAAATFIWEEIDRAGLAEQISVGSAKLLAAAIASNTLNFQIAITSDRDHTAYRAASLRGGFDKPARDEYFAACEHDMLAEFETALRNDTKHESIPQMQGQITIGQLELWHSESIVKAHLQQIEAFLSSSNESWMLNAPSIGDGYSLILTADPILKNALTATSGVQWEGNIGKTPRLMLRKELLKNLRS
jgi:nanoRNase/pAp phosphatase (c-di-AMP/oligoRNAs hydrolase)